MLTCFPEVLSNTIVDRTVKESYILVIHNNEGLAFRLEASICSIGRDKRSAIVLNHPSMSRQHAILMREPVSQGCYSYKLVDGNAKGQLSKNGIFINGKRYSSKKLQNGDMITFGPKIRATYMIIPNSQVNGDRYLEAKQIYSIKEESHDVQTTMIVDDIADDLEKTGFFI